MTGASGFTGSRVVPLLLERGAQVRCLLRPSSDRSGLPAGGVEIVLGDLSDEGSLRRAMEGTDTLVSFASLGFGHAPNLLAAACSAGVGRALFVSTSAIYTRLPAPSRAVRLAAEEAIRRSGVPYVILRPTMIYGSERDRNMSRLIRHLARHRAIVVPGRGTGLLQPVHVDDVARAAAGSLTSARAWNREYNVSGGTALTFVEAIDTICRILGRRVLKLHVPLRAAAAALAMLERFGTKPPVRAEQVLRLDEDKSFDYGDAARDFGYDPRPFEEGIRQEIAGMGLRAMPPRPARHP